MTMRQDTDTAYERLRARLRAANPVPPSYDHLFDSDLLRRLKTTDIVIGDGGEDAEPVKRTRKRKPTLAGVARQAAKAGIDVAGYEVRPDGTIKVITGKPNEATTPDNNDSNEWDGVLQ